METAPTTERRSRALFVWSGGPAPGDLDFAEAVRAEFHRRNIPMFGCRHGLAGLLEYEASALVELGQDSLTSECFYYPPVISFGRGGPGRDDEQASRLVAWLLEQEFRYLIIYGGDGTANTVLTLCHAAERLKAAGKGELLINMGPKSMDRDLPVDAIGFATVSEFLGQLIEQSTRDAQRSDSRWMIIVVQGRTAGWVAFRGATAARAPLWLIPEQFPNSGVNFTFVRDIIVGSMLKSLVGPPHRPYPEPLYLHGRLHGAVVVAEGVALKIKPETFPALSMMKLDGRGRPDLSGFPFEERLADAVNAALGELDLAERLGGRFGAMGERLGYTARGKAPNAIDRELALILGTAIVSQMVDEEVSGAVPFRDAQQDRVGYYPLTAFVGQEGLIRPRLVPVTGDTYRTLWHAFRGGRLLPTDLEGEMLHRLLAVTGLGREQFLARFGPVAKWGA